MLPDLTSRIKQFASEAGFELCGIASVRDYKELQVFPSWIAAGQHGDMKYMAAVNAAGDLKRASAANVAPWARSVIVCAINYNTAYPYSNQTNDPAQGWISRYAWGREDYHDAALRRLGEVEGKLRDLVSSSHRMDPSNHHPASAEHVFRSYVDTGPLIERVFAKYAGIGWIGKNTCIINQKMGSWLFLGVILTSLEHGGEGPTRLQADLPPPDRCGKCARCLDACPTHAFVGPGQLDARLCISYLTIEKRGDISEPLREGMGRHVFGCDICQDVCPWNRKAPVTTAEEFQPREGLVNPGLDWLAEMKPDEFRTAFRGSAVRRAKLTGLRRNAVIAMGNSGNEKFVPTLRRLAEDRDPVVAEHAKWALDKLECPDRNVRR